MIVQIKQPCQKPLKQISGKQNLYDCSHCSKVIVDLSQKTDKELIAFLQNNPTSCAIFHKSQVNRTLSANDWQEKILEKYIESKLVEHKSWKNYLWSAFLYVLLSLSSCKTKEQVFAAKEFTEQKALFEQKDSLRFEMNYTTYGEFEVAKNPEYPGGKKALEDMFKKHLKDYPKPLQITLFISKKGTVSRISVEKINEKALIQELENIAFTKLSSFFPATYDTGKPKEDTYTIVLR